MEGYKVRLSPTLLLRSWRIKRGCWWTTLSFYSRYNPNHVLHRLLPNLEILIAIYVNAITILLCRWTSMLLWSITLFIEWFSKTFI